MGLEFRETSEFLPDASEIIGPLPAHRWLRVTVPPPNENLFMSGPENVDECLYPGAPSSTIPGAQACNEFRKGTDQKRLALFFTRVKPRWKRHLEESGGEPRERDSSSSATVMWRGVGGTAQGH